MSELSAISIAGLAKPAIAPTAGSPPELRWLDIDALYVDMRYQREIGRRSKINIARIAAAFDWAFFAPVIVARAEGSDFFLIIDGQHRTTAAKLIGKTTVPCSIVSADMRKQARAFGAVNGAITRIHPLQMHRSAVAAGDPAALALESIAIDGKARILPSPKSAPFMKPGETMALQTLRSCAERFSREHIVRALLAINTGTRAYRCMLNRDMLEGLCLAMPEGSRESVVAALTKINFGVVEEEARRANAGQKGKLSAHVCAAIEKRIGAKSAPIAGQPPAARSAAR